MRTTAYVLAAMMIVSSLTYATIINVPGDYVTIQEALAVAAHGDTVLVQPGTYWGTITWPGVDDINLLSAGDSSNTIISGNFVDSVIRFDGPGGIDTTTVIRGFTITNGGAGYFGGGIYISYSSPTIEACAITGNQAFAGGGIYCEESDPIIRSCTIGRNLTDVQGGGICSMHSSPKIENCTIMENQDGGIFCDGGSPTIRDCTISGNTGLWIWGGGITCRESALIIENCEIIENAAHFGGGILCWLGTPTLRFVLFEDNSAQYYGGGIYCVESSPSIVHCAITGNHAGDKGDGIYVSPHSFPVISHSNIFQNGMGVFNGDSVQVLDCPDNWWGDATGPYNLVYNPLGLGDSTNATVNPIPFLTEPDSLAPPFSVPGQPVLQPVAFVLHQNYPNPFNPITKLSFDLPVPARVNLSVYDILGRRVMTLTSGWRDAGTHQVTFDGSNLPSGIYFYRLTAGDYTATQKMVLLK